MPPPKATTRAGTRTTAEGRSPSGLAGRAFRVEELGEAGIVLEVGKILVVARQIPVFRPERDRLFQIFHCRFGFAGKAIEGREGVDDVIGFGGQLQGLFEGGAGVIPAAKIFIMATP